MGTISLHFVRPLLEGVGLTTPTIYCHQDNVLGNGRPERSPGLSCPFPQDTRQGSTLCGTEGICGVMLPLALFHIF